MATGPMGSDGQKFFAAFVRTVADAHPRVRLRIVPTADREASPKALVDGEADLAVVRSDEITSTAAQTIAILRRDLAQFESYVYLGTIIVSILGSGLAWMMSAWRHALSQDQEQLLRLLAIVRDVPTADLDTLETLDTEVEAIHAWVLERVANEAMKAEQFQVFSQVVTQVWQVIGKRYAGLR